MARTEGGRCDGEGMVIAETRAASPSGVSGRSVRTSGNGIPSIALASVRIALSPSTLTVRGDPAVIDRLSELVVATIDEKKIAGDSTQLVPLNFEDGITAADGTENVLLTITHVGTYTAVFSVTDIDVPGAVGIRYEILDTSLSVTVRATLEQLSRLRSTDFSAVIDLSGYTADSSGVIREPGVIRIDSVYADGVYEVGEYSVQVKLN